jgi:hypothetical protein
VDVANAAKNGSVASAVHVVKNAVKADVVSGSKTPAERPVLLFSSCQ